MKNNIRYLQIPNVLARDLNILQKAQFNMKDGEDSKMHLGGDVEVISLQENCYNIPT